MAKIKTCAAIHDISGLGKCSLTVALPILSSAGIETSVIPTALFSNHTAFPEFYKHDLTEHMLPVARQWKSFGVEFDSLYSGFLGSMEQINIVSEIFDMFGNSDNLILVDPVMGDNGKLYKTYSSDMADGMIKLCRKADIIVPNMTEAAHLVGTEYKKGPYTKEYVEHILSELLKLGAEYVILTGVYFDDDCLGAACISRASGSVSYCFSTKYDGFFHGTGDVFASVLLAGIVNGMSVRDAMNRAVGFTSKSIKNTIDAGTDPLMGVCFEPELYTLRCTSKI